MPGRIEPADFGPGRFVGEHWPHALAAHPDPRHQQRHLAGRFGPRQQRVHIVVASDQLDGLERGRHQLQRRAAGQRIGRAHPPLLDDFSPVVGPGLYHRCSRNEEARIETLGPAQRREPVAQVDEPIDRQAQAGFLAQLTQLALAPVQRAAPSGQAGTGVGIGANQIPGAIGREQQARLFETFTHSGDKIVEAALRQTQATAGGGIVQTRAAGMRLAIARIDQPTREHPGAAVVVTALGTPAQQHFHARWRVSNDDDGGRRTRRAVAAIRHRGWEGFSGGHGQPHTSRATSTTRSSLRHWSS